MDLVVDLDLAHRVLRITVTGTLTNESLTEVYRTVKRLAARGGPYNGAILDLTQVVHFPVSSDTIRNLASTGPAVPGGGPRIMVARAPALYGLARMFELYRDSMGGKLQTVVKSLDEAYDLLKVTPQEFSEHLFPEDAAA
jgi:hypothetical protein